jgi:DNA polymerase I
MSLRPKRETLKFVAGMLFPEREELQKMDIDASKMDEEWASRPDEVVEYCARDAELPLAILRAIQAVRRKEALGVVAKVSFDTAANGSTSQLLDSLVIRLADKRNIAVPMTNRVTSDSKITGGYVHDVEAGLHPWIAVLDFKSMYPSIMIKNNICYTTRIDDHHPDQPKEGEEIHTSPTGAKFRSADYTKGMIPHLLEDLMARRDLHKTALAVARTEGDDKEIAFHDAMQFAVKIMMNSFYGVFASTFYRFTHIDLGSSITAWARHNIKAIIQGLEKEGIKVVYSDTDSIFVKAGLATNPTKPSPMADPQGQSTSIVKGGKGGEDEMDEDDKKSSPTRPLVTTPEMDEWKRARNDLILFGEGLAKRFTADGAVLEFEKGLSVFFSHGAKKRYVGRVVYPAEEIIIRGYETQRTDSFDALTGGMQGIFDDVLDGEHDNAVKAAMEYIMAAKRNQIPIEQLVISKTCKGKVDKKGNVDFSHHYANPDGQASVQAARKRIERNLPFTPGMKVAFVVTNARNRPMQVEPWDEGQENGGISAYDGEFYAERLATAFGRVTEAFNWSAKELLAGNRQANLFSF